MHASERNGLIERYAAGPARFLAVLTEVPAAAMQWRPAAGKWTVHEVIVHCADSETNAHMRLRYLLAEDRPVIIGYNQDNWATTLDYHAHPIEPALATIVSVRANTVPLLRRLPEASWALMGTHTESGSYGVEDWLRTYSEHLEIHERQIRRNLEAWRTRT